MKQLDLHIIRCISFATFLKTGIIFADFQSLESKPVSSDCLNSNSSGLERLLLAHASYNYVCNSEYYMIQVTYV